MRQRAILDGEFVVYNKRDEMFEAFGCIAHVLIAAREGRPSSEARWGRSSNQSPNQLTRHQSIGPTNKQCVNKSPSTY